MNFETKKQFFEFMKSGFPHEVAKKFLLADFVHAIPEKQKYTDYISTIKIDYPSAQRIAIMGSGNWRFSLNPENNFSEYHKKSDIDVAVICPENFALTWEELRKYHRKNWYILSQIARADLLRNGENVYAGFVSPKWISGASSLKFDFNRRRNGYSTDIVGHRDVNMMYFKNEDELIDYYVRGIRLATKRN